MRWPACPTQLAALEYQYSKHAWYGTDLVKGTLYIHLGADQVGGQGCSGVRQGGFNREDRSQVTHDDGRAQLLDGEKRAQSFRGKSSVP